MNPQPVEYPKLHPVNVLSLLLSLITSFIVSYFSISNSIYNSDITNNKRRIEELEAKVRIMKIEQERIHQLNADGKR